MAITTSNSINVKPGFAGEDGRGLNRMVMVRSSVAKLDTSRGDTRHFENRLADLK